MFNIYLGSIVVNRAWESILFILLDWIVWFYLIYALFI